jgi:hypothetical protein
LRSFVIALVSGLQRASTDAEFVELQRALLEQFLRHQLAQEQLRERVARLKKERAVLVRDDPRPIAAIRSVSASIEADELLDHTLGCALHALRCVGDGMAWAIRNFDRAAIAVMGDGRRVGRLASAAGLKAELARLDDLWYRRGRFALLNDLTNCARYGDVTIRPREPDEGAPEVAEVKAGRNSKPAQRARLQERTAFLRTGYKPPVDGAPAQRVLVPAPVLEVYHASLRNAIRRAREAAIAEFSPHPCMTVAVADYRRLDETPERGEHWTAQAPRRRGWEASDPRVIQVSSFIRRLREQRDSFAFIAPYAIFPLRAEDAADLILGRLDICASLSCDELTRALATGGLQCDVAGGSAANEFFLRATDGANTVSLPPVIREQMLTELMSPETLVAAIRHALVATAADAGERPAQQLVRYAGEADVWRRR